MTSAEADINRTNFVLNVLLTSVISLKKRSFAARSTCNKRGRVHLRTRPRGPPLAASLRHDKQFLITTSLVPLFRDRVKLKSSINFATELVSDFTINTKERRGGGFWDIFNGYAISILNS